MSGIATAEPFFSIAQMKADYEAMLATAAEGGDDDRPVVDLAKGTGRKTAKERGSIEAQRALDEVKKDNGTFNWPSFSIVHFDEPSMNRSNRRFSDFRP